MNEYVIYGRTWKEYNSFISWLKGAIDNKILVLYVHNLSYEFQYLKTLIHFEANYEKGNDTVFFNAPRTVLKCIDDNIEYRCSYLLTNMSLSRFTKEMGIINKKLSGIEFNYNKVRYPWTKLTNEELHYCINDVKGLCEALEVKFNLTNEDICSIPLTSTGYVRRDIRHVCRNIRKKLDTLMPSLEIYELLRQAFRGGNTHANRYLAGMIIDNVVSADRSSSYPDVLVNDKYPITKFKQCNKDVLTLNDVPFIVKLKFTNLKVHDDVTVPYISDSRIELKGNRKYDNGRILEADEITMSITDIDYKIIRSQYNIEHIEFIKGYRSTYGYLPIGIRQTVIEYYENKTSLKGISGKELNYALSKALLNSIYGMTAQDPVKQPLLFDGRVEEYGMVDKQELLDNAKPVLPYQWGVWTTALARYRLQEGIDLVGENFVYADTDSVKYINDDKFKQLWNVYNRERIKNSLYNGAYADDKHNITHYMGVYEYDGKYTQFITLGAKRYAYTDDSGLHITVSGVTKKDGAKELGKIENFKDGFIWKEAGRNVVKYYDLDKIEYINIANKRVEVTSYVVIEESTYELTMQDDYKDLIHYACNI